MNKAPMKLLFMMMLIMGTLISTSSNNWLGVWMGLEINLMSFIPLITYNKNFNSNISGIKYFIVQALASIILLSVIINLMITEMYNDIFTSLMAISILMKIGAAPLHFWFPEIMEHLNWNNCMLLMTWQKIAPMLILTYIEINQLLISLFIMTSAIVGGVMGLNQISMRLILAYSSINHIGWMLSALNSNSNIWFIYFLLYMLMTTLISLSFKSNNIIMINEIFFNKNNNKINKINLMISLLSLGGMPPLLGFLPKWLLINEMIMKNNYFMVTILIISSTITLYFYMKTFLSAGLISSSENKWYLTEFQLKSSETLSFYMNMYSTLGLIISNIFIF